MDFRRDYEYVKVEHNQESDYAIISSCQQSMLGIRMLLQIFSIRFARGNRSDSLKISNRQDGLYGCFLAVFKLKRSIYYFPSIFIIWKENHPFKTLKSKVLLRFCQLLMSDVSESVECSDREKFLPPNYSKFAPNGTEIIGFFKTYKIWLLFRTTKLSFSQNR